MGVACAIARAEDKPAPARGEAEASISSAKKDFDTIKAARDAALQAKAEGLRLETPTMETDPSASPAAWLRAQKEKEKELAAKKKKSANWLLEAMEKDRETKPERGDTARSAETQPTAVSITGERASETAMLAAAAQSAADDKAKEEPAAPPVVNPLTRYMSDWMTPKDFALLQSAPGVASAKEGLAGAGPGNASPDAGGPAGVSLPGAAGGLEMVFGSGSTNRPGTLTPARENPFLQALGPLPTANAGPVAPFAPPPALAPLPPISGGLSSPTGFQPAPAPELPQPRSSVPDFARPAIDDKAFKPMKRF